MVPPSSANVAAGSAATLTIPVPLGPPPLAPWFRFGIHDCKVQVDPEPYAPVRRFRDFSLHLLLEGHNWVWCEALEGSLELAPGQLCFFPPGFVHAWAFTSETHLAVHYDLQHNPEILPAHNEDMQFRFITYEGRVGMRAPVATMPVFQLHYPGQPPDEGWHIPLITTVTDLDTWRERLGALVYRWQTGGLDTVAATLESAETLLWALKSLAAQSVYAVPAEEDPRIVALLRRLQDPQELATLARCSVDELARQAGMGLTNFRKQFIRVTGRTPHQYIRERQIQQAATMLKKSPLSVRAIADAVGFEDSFHFSRIFHQMLGCPPARFRRQGSGGD
jgi:AraC-like DNA-binding protein